MFYHTQTKLRDGNVFRGVYLSTGEVHPSGLHLGVHEGMHPWVATRGTHPLPEVCTPCQKYAPLGRQAANRQAVRILLECILVVSIFTARIVKRAKVVFTGVCHSVILGEVLHQMHHGIGHMVRGGRGADNTSPPPWEQVTTPPPLGTRSQHLPPPTLEPGHNTSLPPPRDYAQAGGTHPTGMHSCLTYNQRTLRIEDQ